MRDRTGGAHGGRRTQTKVQDRDDEDLGRDEMEGMEEVSTERSTGRSSRGASRGSSRGRSGGGGSRSRTTWDHEEIRRWAEARDGVPARVRGTGDVDEPGMIQLDFPGYTGRESLEEISWEEWFNSFDRNNLALVYQET